MTTALISADNISVIRNGHYLLNNASIHINSAEIVTLIGPNGAGKTTLVRTLLGLMAPTRGSIQRTSNLTIGYMPQKLHIEPSLPLTVSHFLALSGQSRKAISESMATVGIEHLQHRQMQHLSGGETQRALLARALVRNPNLLVLDEPAQGVDVAGQTALYRLITDLRDERGCAVLLVSHDLHLVMSTTDTVICLNQHVCCQGRPENVSHDPAYLELFGDTVHTGMAVYTHHHDHQHEIFGNTTPCDQDEQGSQSEQSLSGRQNDQSAHKCDPANEASTYSKEQSSG